MQAIHITCIYKYAVQQLFYIYIYVLCTLQLHLIINNNNLIFELQKLQLARKSMTL